MESQFCAEYSELRVKVMQFATDLLDHARTSYELEIMLNYDADGDVWDPGETQTLERLKLALKFKQKQFVAHPSVQQLLATIWYEGLPGWRRLNFVGQGLLQIMGHSLTQLPSWKCRHLWNIFSFLISLHYI